MIVTQPVHLLSILALICLGCTWAPAGETRPIALRMATFNIEDVRSSDLETPDNPRLKQIAAIIQRMRPNILLLNELAVRQDDSATNADRFVNLYLSVSQGEGLSPINFQTFTPATNTGAHSGHDLDNSGSIVSTFPEITPNQTAAGRAYGNDCFGFGTFPGQYGMALLISPKLTIQTDQIRTFQHLLWKDLPGFSPPRNADGTNWYSDEAWDNFRLTSKNFADIPILLPNGSILHTLISHPTPPAFDGQEGRNKHRNHDEIKLIRHYIDNDHSLVDDRGLKSGLDKNASFVIMGDLNADPSAGSSINMAILTQILTSPRIADDVFPSSDLKVDGLDPTDTAHFRLRVDYVLPSSDIKISNSGIWRLNQAQSKFPSDHFPVWIEAIIP
jgi:endonuclease/exonuclease/phosphatase family metal-dependent hydrolase